jgi:hypothetical protein
MTPATVPEAYPPSPFDTSHSRVAIASGSTASIGGHARRRIGNGF